MYLNLSAKGGPPPKPGNVSARGGNTKGGTPSGGKSPAAISGGGTLPSGRGSVPAGNGGMGSPTFGGGSVSFGGGTKSPTAKNLFNDDKLVPTSPYTYFYPGNVAETVTLLDELTDPSRSPDFQDRLNARQKKKQFFDDQNTFFEHFKSTNLITIHKAFMQFVSEEGALTRAQFASALHSMGVTNRSIVDRSFDLFDSQKEGIIDYREVIAAIEVIVNGTNKANKIATMKDCFALFDPANCGFIIQTGLTDIKRNRSETDGINHLMVKALLEIFDQLQKEEDERRRKDFFKKNKKGKKGAAALPPPTTAPPPPPQAQPQAPPADGAAGGPPSGTVTSGSSSSSPGVPVGLPAIPTTAVSSDALSGGGTGPGDIPRYCKKIHLSFDEFCHFMDTNPQLVQAFLPQILITMEQLYNRNKKIMRSKDSASDLTGNPAASP